MNKKIIQRIDYGIYIEQNHAILVSIQNGITEETDLLSQIISRERFQGETSDKINPAVGRSDNRDRQHQNKLNTELKKFCKGIVAQLKNANRILIFGPSESKFE